MSSETALSGHGAAHLPKRDRMPHPIVLMVLIIVAAVALTWIVPSGEYKRGAKGVVQPGTYQVIPKDLSLQALIVPTKSTAQAAHPASLVDILASIPVGMSRSAGLIFMIMFIGGMFGVLRASGALDTGMERLLALTRGNVYLLAPVLMIAISAGSTFLGLISEYLMIIPMMLVLSEKLKLNPMFATALVAIPAKIGYLASVTNPLPLVIAQPIVGVPVFSGLGFRLVIWIVFLTIGIAYLLWFVYRSGFQRETELALGGRLPARHIVILLVVAASVVGLIYGTDELKWGNNQLGAYYILLAILVAAIAGLPARRAAETFLDGMKGMVLAALLVGLAGAVEEVLRTSLVLDTIIKNLSSLAEGRSPPMVAQALIFIEMILDVLIPSTSGKAAVSMPILGPIAQLSGVTGQTTVLAFLFGNGLMNIVTPTSGMLLAYLATGRVSYGDWIKFILPLVGVLTVLSFGAMAIAAMIGY